MLFYDSFFCSLPLPNSTYILSIYGQQECSGLFGVYNPLKTCWSPIVAAFEYNWWFWRRRTILLSFYGRGSSLIQSGKKTTRKMSYTYDKIHNLRDTIKEWMNHMATPIYPDFVKWNFDFKRSICPKAQFPKGTSSQVFMYPSDCVPSKNEWITKKRSDAIKSHHH